MAYLKFTIDSKTYRSREEVSVVIPDGQKLMPCTQKYPPGYRFPVLWLFHDAGGGSDDIFVKTQLEYFMRRRELIVIMPTIRGIRLHGKADGRDGEYMRELLEVMQRMLPISRLRTGNYIAGLGAGGRFALDIAANRDTLFSKAGALSGRLEKYPAISNQVMLYAACGREDPNYRFNRNFVQDAREKGIDVTWRPSPDTSGWRYWDVGIRELVDWVDAKKPEKEGEPRGQDRNEYTQ